MQFCHVSMAIPYNAMKSCSVPNSKQPIQMHTQGQVPLCSHQEYETLHTDTMSPVTVTNHDTVCHLHTCTCNLMSRRRKKVKVFHIPRDEMISVTSISSLGGSHQVVTPMSLSAPLQDDGVQLETTSPTLPEQVTSHDATQAKKRYASTVSHIF